MRNMRKTAGRFYAVILGVTERLYAVKLKDKIGNKKQQKVSAQVGKYRNK